MKPKAFIYGELPHKELSIHEVPLWSFNDKDNVHEIENQKQMAEEIVATRGYLNNHLIYSQEDYPGIINDASIEPVAKVSHIKYDEDTKTFIADIISTNQQFIELIAATEYFPRVHPCYEAETNRRFVVGELTTVTSIFKRLLCWLVEPEKNKTKLSIEYHPEGRSDESKNNDIDNEKANRWETMRTGINTTLDSFCDTLISNSIVGGSYEKSGSLRRITLGEKIIDVILEYDVDLDSWLIFIGDPTKPRIVVNANEHIVADISAFIPDPLCMKDIQTLCDMLGVCRNNNWQVKEDTHEEQMESCETSDDKEEVSKLIPKEELMKIIFENIKGILENDLSYHKYPWACPDNSWSLTAYDDSFRYVIYDRQHCVSKSIGCNLNKDHWEIYIEKGSNVNIVAYPDEACWMTDALLFRTPNKDFPKDVLENIITDINAWIKTKTMPNKELSAFSQSLIKDGKRPTKEEYYLAMAEVASTRGTCLRRRFGSVIVKDDRIVSTGYVGAPSGRQNCCDIGYCFREANNIPHGAMYERCRSSHSEMNAIINASKEEMKGATLYLVGVEPDGSYTNSDCCAMCKRVIINSGIEKVVAKQKNGMYNIIPVKEWIEHDDSLDINHRGY
jgi:dCMP deaminase